MSNPLTLPAKPMREFFASADTAPRIEISPIHTEERLLRGCAESVYRPRMTFFSLIGIVFAVLSVTFAFASIGIMLFKFILVVLK